MRRLSLFGAGGHGRELAWLAQEVHGPGLAIEFLVDDPRFVVDDVEGHPVRLLEDVEEGPYVAAIGSPAARARAVVACDAAGLRATVLLHPRAEIAPTATFGEGSVVCAGSVVSVNVSVGRHVHVNVGCTVSHDVVLEDLATLSPGVRLAGNVRVETGAFLGIGATVINGHAGAPLVIGAGAVVAAGACVTENVAAGALVAGVPAVRKR